MTVLGETTGPVVGFIADRSTINQYIFIEQPANVTGSIHSRYLVYAGQRTGHIAQLEPSRTSWALTAVG